MFDNEPIQIPPQAPAPQPQMPPQEVHTMPERFLDAGMPSAGGTMPGAGKTGGSGFTKKLIIAGVSVVVVGALGAGAWYYFTKMANNNTNNENIAVVNTNTNRNANTNANQNVNALLNANVNLNLNANSNANLNSNLNTNGTTNQNLNSNLNTNANANGNSNSNTNASVTTTGSPLPSSTDTDSDGLTDVEEQVYSTNANNPDTDADGFIDGMRQLATGSYEGEIYNGYCPTKTGSVRLDDATCSDMKTYTNTTFNYAMWVPKNWLVQPTSSDQKTVIITPDIATSEFFQVTVLDNPTQLTAKNYYLSLNPGVDPTMIKDATTNGLDGVISLDQTTVYLVKGTKIYVVTYNTDSLVKINFKTTFSAMYRSFHLVAATTTNTNTNTLNTNR